MLLTSLEYLRSYPSILGLLKADSTISFVRLLLLKQRLASMYRNIRVSMSGCVGDGNQDDG